MEMPRSNHSRFRHRRLARMHLDNRASDSQRSENRALVLLHLAPRQSLRSKQNLPRQRNRHLGRCLAREQSQVALGPSLLVAATLDSLAARERKRKGRVALAPLAVSRVVASMHRATGQDSANRSQRLDQAVAQQVRLDSQLAAERLETASQLERHSGAVSLPLAAVPSAASRHLARPRLEVSPSHLGLPLLARLAETSQSQQVSVEASPQAVGSPRLRRRQDSRAGAAS